MSHLISILFLLVCLGAASGYGRAWLRWLRCGDSPLQPLYALALGLGTLSYATLALGLAGLLQPVYLAGLLALGGVLALLERFRHRGSASRPRSEGGTGGSSELERWLALGLLAFSGVLALVTLASALRPVDGMDWDSLSYHLAAPKIYLRQGRISMLVYDSHTDFPFTMEMLYTLGLAFAGPAGAKLLHWAAGWLTAAAVGVWTSRLTAAGRPAPLWAGPLAALAFAGMPIVLWEMGTAYVDLGTALFQFLALTALLGVPSSRFRVPGSGPGGDEVPGLESEVSGSEPVLRAAGSSAPAASGTPRPSQAGGPTWNLEPGTWNLILAGALSGFALGTKMTALIQFGLLGLGLVWLAVRAPASRRGGALGSVVLFGAVGLLVGAPWYVKSWLWAHNPVYPFFYSLFPHSFSWTPQAGAAYSSEQKSFGLGKGPRELALVFWNLSVHGRAFYINLRSMVGDKVGSLGPLWIGLLPLVLWARRLDWRAWAALAYGLASLLIWFGLTQQTRYLIPIFAPLAAVVALVVASLPSRVLRAGAGVFAGLALALSLWMHQPLAQDSLQVLTGARTDAEYLQASLGGLYEASVWVNSLPEPVRVAMYQENRGFYIDRDYFWANPLQHNLIPYTTLRNGGALVDYLRRFGITHVLINYDFAHGVEGEAWYRLLRSAIDSGRLREVFASQGAVDRQRGVLIYQVR